MTRATRLSIWTFLGVVGGLLLTLSFWGHSFVPAFGQEEVETTRSSKREDVVLSLNGAVTPTSADYLKREIAQASDAQKELIILEIDTPGGLVTSMESIIKAILNSDTPVATFVSPQGAKSASAGLYIMYAAHISAMAPATNTGSATPIQLGGGPESEPGFDPIENPNPDTESDKDGEGQTPDLEGGVEENASPSNSESARRPLSNSDALRAKIINNSVAYIQSLAELRGRNAEWAEKAVREAANIPATEALRLNVIDLIADDMDDLLRQINGRTVKVASGEKTVNTDGIILTRIEPTLAETILGFFADPNVAAILMSIGMLGLTVELWNPGSVFPGVVGVLCLGLGLYAAQTLPFAWLGVWMIVCGILFLVLEAYTPTLGIVGLIGLITFGAGLYLLFPETLRVSNSVIISAVAIAGAVLSLILFALVGSRSHGPLIGAEAIRRREGYVDEWDGLEGYVVVEGERWQARSATPLKVGDRVKVTDVDGLVLIVRRAKGESSQAKQGSEPVRA